MIFFFFFRNKFIVLAHTWTLLCTLYIALAYLDSIASFTEDYARLLRSLKEYLKNINNTAFYKKALTRRLGVSGKVTEENSDVAITEMKTTPLEERTAV